MSRLGELRALHAQGRLVLKARGRPEAGSRGGAPPATGSAPGGSGPASCTPVTASPAAGATLAAGAGPVPVPGGAADGTAPGGPPAADGPGHPFTPSPTPAGTAWCWRTVYPAAFAHGSGTPATWYRDLRRSLAVLAAVAGPVRSRQPAPAAVEQLLFLDLETTGLAVGAGHRPFLAGLAWFDAGGAGTGDRGGEPRGAGTPGGGPGSPGAAEDQAVAEAVGPVLVVEQYLVPDLEPETERAWLAAIARRLAEHPWLVTFNGRGFDWPMLETRWHWHRRTAPAPAGHLDLLYPARRLWAGPAQRVNLRALESRLLGVQRQGDVQGAEIPERFARFLRRREGPHPEAPMPPPPNPAGTTGASGRPRDGAPDPARRGPVPAAGDGAAETLDPLLPVLRHNLVDLLSLVGIAAWLGGWLLAGPPGARRWDEALAAGREWERIDPDVATRWYERALVLARGRGAVAAVARRLVPLYRRQRRWGDAVAVQAALCDAHHPLAPVEPWLDLAELWLRAGQRQRAAACLDQAERLWERRRRLPVAGTPRPPEVAALAQDAATARGRDGAPPPAAPAAFPPPPAARAAPSRDARSTAPSRVERRIAHLRQRLTAGPDGTQARAL